MRILFLTQLYAPEEVSGAVLISELATDLVNRGHQVTVVTGAPNYPLGRVFPGYHNRVYQVEWLDGVQVIRTWSYISPHKTFLRRVFHYGTYCTTAFYGVLLAVKPEVIVNILQPLPLGLSAWLLSRLWHVPLVLKIDDVFPEAAVAAGVLRNRSAIAFFSAMALFLYQRATHISVISENFRQNLLGKGISPEKITLIPVWADPDLVRPLPKENAFRTQHGLEGKFVVMYAGNLGLTSSLEDVLYAAEQLSEDSCVRFVFIGEGVKKPALEKMSLARGLQNVVFLPYQPREVFPEMLAAADLSLVTLNYSSSLTSLPSKTFNIMASARPILVIAPPESEIANIVEEAKCGVIIPPEHPELLAEVILRLKEQGRRLTEMGQNGRAQLATRFARASCVDMYEHMLLTLLQSCS